MSIQRQRANSSRSKRFIVKVKHISKRLPQDFFSKTISEQPRKLQLDFNQKQVINWYERDESAEKNKYIRNPRLLKRNDPARHSKFLQPIQPLQISNENQIFYNRLFQSSNHKQNIILKVIKKTDKQAKIKVTAVSTINQKQKQSNERVVKSQYKRHRRFQSPIISRTSVIKSASMSIRQIKGQSPSRYDNMNVGLDGFLTFNRFS